MEHIYEYLIGGKKIGQKKEAPTFDDLREGDIFYIYNFNIKLDMTRSDQRRVDKIVRRSGGNIHLDSTGSAGGKGQSSWPADRNISIWTTDEMGAYFCVATTEPWNQKDLIEAIRTRYKKAHSGTK